MLQNKAKGVIFSLILMLMINCSTRQGVKPDNRGPDYWPTKESTPEEQGIDSRGLSGLFKKIQRYNYVTRFSGILG